VAAHSERDYAQVGGGRCLRSKADVYPVQGDEHQRSDYTSNEHGEQDYNAENSRNIGDQSHISLSRNYPTTPGAFPDYSHSEDMSAYAQAEQEHHQMSMSKNIGRDKERQKGRTSGSNSHGKRPVPPRDPAIKIQQLEEQLSAYVAENSVLRTNYETSNGYLQGEYQLRLKLEKENANLLKVQKEQSSQVRMAQELMLKETKKGHGGLADEDRTIRHNFKKLQTDIKDWGRLWASKNILAVEELKETDSRSEAMAFLARVVRIDDDHLPKGLTSTKMTSKAPAMCLSALLYHEICLSVLEKPFGHLKYGASDDAGGKALAKADGTLDKIYSELSKCTRFCILLKITAHTRNR
jgi:hypothetical protein